MDIVLSIHQAWNGERAMGKAIRDTLLAEGRQAELEERSRFAPLEALTPREQVVLGT